MKADRFLIQRRQLLALAAAGSSAVAAAEPAISVGELLAADLDPFATYCRMFASANAGDECAWWFMGALPMQVADIGAVEYLQEETIRVHRVERAAPGQVDIVWQEAGVFRDITTGAVPTGWYNPINGIVQPQNAQLRSRINRHVIRKSAGGVEIELQAENVATSKITLDGRVNGNRVCLTHVEEKTRTSIAGAAPSIIRTVFKLYASLADLRAAGGSVSANGFYGVRNLTTGNVFVNGLMHKANLDEKVNPLAWERVKAKASDFFQGDRLAPKW